MTKTIDAGCEAFVSASRVLVILPGSQSAPIARLRKAAGEKDLLVDATFGGKKESVIVLDSGHIVLSTVEAGLLRVRMGHKHYE